MRSSKSISLQALLVWIGSAEEHRCTCVVEVPSLPEPNKAVLDLLEKQLDRCGPEHQTCHACPQCPALEPQVQWSAAPTGFGAFACALSLFLGIFLGRVSSNLSLVVDKHNSSSSDHERERSANENERKQQHRDRQEHQNELTKYTDDGRHEQSDDRPEPAGNGKFEGESGLEEEHGLVRRLEDDLDEEERLGIIDAGDEEWLEVHDVIREHSAVTIFNHTDSTWYVSSKHPHFVRPLHGKHRHPLRNMQNRQGWRSESLGRISESVARHPSPDEEEPDIDIGGAQQADLSIHSWRGEETVHFGSSVRGTGFGIDASSHIKRLHRRPHSAPSLAAGRVPATLHDTSREARQNPKYPQAAANDVAFTRVRGGSTHVQEVAHERTPSV